MTMNSPADVVDAYLDALRAGDFARMRDCLSSERFSYRGPTGDYDDADAFVESLVAVPAILEGIDLRRRFVDGNEVCDVLNFRTRMSELSHTGVAQWATVENDKIVSLQSFFDAHAYKLMFEG